MIKLIKELHENKDTAKVKVLQSFFKTGKGEYGEGDTFLGIPMTILRKLTKDYSGEISLENITKLLYSKIHEERMLGVLFLIDKYEKGDLSIYDFYLKHAKQINDWDLVDVSCHKIVGEYLLDKERSILSKLAKSENLWERRIAIVSTFQFIRRNEFDDTLKISRILLKDEHDLIHKAVGWMLREVGKRERSLLVNFIEENLGKIPKVTLRYAVGKFPKEERMILYKKNNQNS